MLPNIMLFGERGSGKDTAALWLVENAGYRRFSFGDEIRNIAMMFGIDNPKREHLVGITEMAYKIFGEKIWINLALKRFQKFSEEDYVSGISKPIVISDMRYPEIYRHFLQEGFYPVHIISKHENNVERVLKRDGYYPEKLMNDRSEQEYNNFIGYRIYNDYSFTHLHKQLEFLVKQLKEREPECKVIK